MKSFDARNLDNNRAQPGINRRVNVAKYDRYER